VADVPSEHIASLGGLKQQRVRGTINGAEYTWNVMPAGGGRLALSVSKAMLRSGWGSRWRCRGLRDRARSAGTDLSWTDAAAAWHCAVGGLFKALFTLPSGFGSTGGLVSAPGIRWSHRAVSANGVDIDLV